MPAWILSALTTLRAAAFGTPLRGAITGTGVGIALDTDALFPTGLAGIGAALGGGGRSRKRRRTRALTKSDMTDLAFLSSMMSKAGVERIAALMVAKS